MPKHRLERVNELLKRELGEMLRRDFVFEAPLVTVQQVDVTPDLKHAHVYLSVIGSPAQQQKALSRILAKRGPLQYAISRRVVMKYTPQLHFKLDTGIERGNHVIQIMDELHLLPEKESPRPFGGSSPDEEGPSLEAVQEPIQDSGELAGRSVPATDHPDAVDASETSQVSQPPVVSPAPSTTPRFQG
jgi:ribosome-binding factor A